MKGYSHDDFIPTNNDCAAIGDGRGKKTTSRGCVINGEIHMTELARNGESLPVLMRKLHCKRADDERPCLQNWPHCR